MTEASIGDYPNPDILLSGTSSQYYTAPPTISNEFYIPMWKYSEDKILKDIKDYVISTYSGHYTGTDTEDRNIQTIDLMGVKNLAVPFCQASILKYASRYGEKNGRNKKDIMKVIHYAMLLLHFDEHYSRLENGLDEFKPL